MLIPTWDLIVSLIFIVLIVYGLALGRQRILVLIVCSYIGLIIATIWGGAVYSFFTGGTNVGDNFMLRTNASLFTVKSILFIAVTLLLVVKGEFLKTASAAHQGIFSLLISGVYSFLSAGLILTAISSFLPDAQRTTILAQSTLASLIIKYQTWWIVAPALLMIGLGFRSEKEE